MIRVFPRRTSLTPDDDLVFIGEPPMIRPVASEVHISCAFTWDKPYGEHLAQAWGQYYPTVKIGGPAYGSKGEFVPGRYIKQGVTFTSRGCPNHCDFCLVPEREGKLIELENYPDGWTIQDNNLTACSRPHIEGVFKMLRRQSKGARFRGGLESRKIDSWWVDQLKQTQVNSIFLACDKPKDIDPLRHAVDLLGWLGRDKLQCYVLIGKDETVSRAYERLSEVWGAGCLPFAQLFQPPDKWIEYPKEWTRLARIFSRPAATKAWGKAGVTPFKWSPLLAAGLGE